MHPVDIPEHALARALRRRGGRRHARDRIEAGRTALLVIDMQEGFLGDSAGVPAPAARAIVPTIDRLAAAMRAAGGTVVWVTIELPADARDTWSSFLANFFDESGRETLMASLGPGGSGLALWPELDPREGDWYAVKSRFSPFIEGASDLEPRLRAAEIDTVVVTGTLSHVCCEATARDAMMRNFGVVFVADANAAPTDEDHRAALSNVVQIAGDVMTAEEVIARLEPAGARAAE